MKQHRIFSAVAIVVGSLTVLNRVQAEALAADDFNRANSNELGLTPVGGFSWIETEHIAVGAPEIRIENNRAYLAGRAHGDDIGAILGGLTLENVDMSVTFTPDADTPSNFMGGVQYRVPSTTNQFYNVIPGYSIFVVKDTWGGPLTVGRVELSGFGNFLAGYNNPGGFVPGTDYTLRVVANGSQHKVYLNDALVIDYTDPEPSHDVAGYVGLGTMYGNYRYDNFTLFDVGGRAAGWTAGSGDWNNAANWFGPVPNSADALANFETPGSSNVTVYSDAPVTAGRVRFASNNLFNITGAGPLTIQTSAGSGMIEVAQGNQKINLPLILASDTTVTVAPGASLTIADPVTIRANKTLTKSGNVTIAAPLVMEAAATLVAGPGSLSIFGVPTMAAGAKLDAKTSTLVVNYQGQSSAASAVRAQLASAFAGGAWTGSGITTSSSITGQTGLGWKDDPTAQSVLVKYAYYGDANLDGAVSTSDFNALAINFNGSGKVWSLGDFNYDGVVNALDFNALAANFGKTLASPSLGAVVPEPVGSFLAIASLSLIARRRGFRRD